jgi:hypothetical protein
VQKKKGNRAVNKQTFVNDGYIRQKIKSAWFKHASDWFIMAWQKHMDSNVYVSWQHHYIVHQAHL